MRLALFCLTYAAAAARVTSDAPEIDCCACRELGDDVHASRRLTSKHLDDTSIRTAVQLWFSDQDAAEAMYGSISTWNTNLVTNMSYLLCADSTRRDCHASQKFNEAISAWDTSSVTTMDGMFYAATSFNQPIGDWRVDKVTSMESMFEDAKVFNHYIGSWNVENVVNMKAMFFLASSFNTHVGNWSVQKVTDMGGMFAGASAFSQPIGMWRVDSVTRLDSMFAYAAAFNQPLGASNPAWAVGSVITMESMFEKAASFNQGLGWCVDGINVIDAFTGTPCQETSCGLVSGACPPVAQEFGAGYCQLYNKSVCWGNSRMFVEPTRNPLDGVAVDQFSAPALVQNLYGDGRTDLLLGSGNGTLAFYRGDDTGFRLVVGASDPFAGISVGGYASPALVDLTGDELLDLVIGAQGGGLAFYKNTGTASTPEFTMVSDAVGPCGDELVPVNASECPADADKLALCDAVPCGALCEGGSVCGTSDSLDNCGDHHEYSHDVYRKICEPREGPFYNFSLTPIFTAPAFADLDLDGDQDMLVGERDGKVLYYRNDGTSERANFTDVTRTLRDDRYRTSQVHGYSKPALIDLDKDGRVDVVLGTDLGSLVFFRNSGSVSFPLYALVAECDSPFVAAVGPTFATPAFGLLDGRMSLIVGSAPGRLDFYLDVPRPMFSRAEGPFGGISMDGAIFPAFVNLYGAGDDLVLGTDAGPLILYRRDGARFLRVQGVDDPFAELDVNNPASSAPAFADVDNDGDNDLLVGASDGTLQYWRNDGNSSHPRFVRADGADDPFGGIKKQIFTNSMPTFADLNGLALVVGSGEGELYYYRVEGAENPFDSVRVGTDSAPAFADVDGDGALDLCVGQGNGELYFFKNAGTSSDPEFRRVVGAGNPFTFNVGRGSSIAPTFAYLDNDDSPDLIVGGDGSLTYFENGYCALLAGDFPCSNKGECVETAYKEATCVCSGSFTGDQCEACKPGFFERDCRQCAGNTFSTGGVPQEGDTCTSCEAGYFAFSGQAVCNPCPAGRYRGLNTTTDLGRICVQCERNSFSAEGAAECASCDPDTFSAPGSSKCEPCPPGENRPEDQLFCQKPASKKGGDSELKHDRELLTILLSVIGSVFVALMLTWACLSARSYARRKEELELERAVVVQEQCTAARDQVKEFQAHFVTKSGKRFVSIDRLRSHEECRDELIIYDSVADVRDASTRGEVFVFLSHQWLAWSEPDPQRIHIKAMQQAVRFVSKDTDTPLEKIRVWVDYISIPQRNRSVQKTAIASAQSKLSRIRHLNHGLHAIDVIDATPDSLIYAQAIASLPTFASVSDYFIVIAPNATHADTCLPCDSRTYRRRAWCRAEIMSCWARAGMNDMYYNSNAGLKPLVVSDEILHEALDVMHGEYTCCRLGHPGGVPCDREELMLPLLGLYADVYKERNGRNADAYAFIEPRKHKLFPATFDYVHRDLDGVETTTRKVLFGDLVAAVEDLVDQDTVQGSVRKDYKPGTNAQRHRFHHSRHGRRSISTTSSFMSLPSFMSPRGRDGGFSSDTSTPTQPAAVDRRLSWRTSAPESSAGDDEEEAKF